MYKVFSIGNTLMSDDGIAHYVLQDIKDNVLKLPKQIEVIFGEDDYMFCLYKVLANDTVIIIDGNLSGAKIGSVKKRLINQFQCNKFHNHHKKNLNDLISSKKINQKIFLITIEIQSIDYGSDLTLSIKKKFKKIKRKVYREIKKILYEED